MKKNKGIKAFTESLKKRTPVLVVSGVLIAGLVGGAYYLAQQQGNKLATSNDTKTTTTDTKVQSNTDGKDVANNDTATTTPTTTATTPAQTSLSDMSLSVLHDGDQAYVYLYGPAGTYGIETLTNGNWETLVSSFDYSGHGGSQLLDTITSSVEATHYRVFKLTNGVRTATSGDTTVTWQQILNNGTLTVPLAG